MNRVRAIEAVKSIQVAIELARSDNTNPKLTSNFDIGIRLCNELCDSLRTTEETWRYHELMSSFDRFFSDSLPWTNSLLLIIERERKLIKEALRERLR